VTANPIAPPPVQLRLVGAPGMRLADGPWQRLAAKDALLLARLALHGHQPRSAVAAWLWPGAPLPRSHANLRQRLFRLRLHLGGPVREEADGLRLASHVHCDVQTTEGKTLQIETPAADDGVGAPLLEGLSESDESLAAWVDEARLAWAAVQLDRLAGRVASLQARGELAAALPACERLLALDPLREHSWRALMRLHHQRGDRAAAVAAFERCERVLRDELGLKPSPETLALLAQVEALCDAPLPQRTPLPPSLLRPPRLVARRAELTRMAAAWQGQRSFVLLAEAGLGKSRLLAEFAAAQPGVVQEGARPGDESVPYGLLVRLLRRLAQALPETLAPWPVGRAREEVARLLPELGPAPAAPGLQALLHGALDETFAQAAAAGVAGVLVDDLQHADPASEAVLVRAAAAGQALRWGFARRGAGATAAAGVGDLQWWASSARVDVVPLAPLSQAATQELLSTLETPGLEHDTLGPRLLQQCGGNPLHLLETLKHLVLEPDLVRQPDWPVPATVQAVIRQRLAGLSREAVALARVAAVAAGDFSAGVAAEVLGCTLLDLADAWSELLAAQVLHDQGFVHDALREVVLAGVPQALRGPLHERLAFSLQRHGQPAAAVARHFAQASLWPAAARAELAAAADARRLGRTAERLQHLQTAATAFDRAGEPAEAFTARLDAIEPCLTTTGLAQALDACDALQPAALHAAQQRALALARAAAALNGYRADLAAEAATQANASAAPGSLDALRGGLLHAAALSMLGRSDEIRPALEHWREPLERLNDPFVAATLWSHWALVEHAAGRVRPCIDALLRQQELARAAGDAAVEAQALASLAGQHTTVGEAERGIDEARRAAALHRRMGEPHAALLADANLAIGLIGCERLHDALLLLQAAPVHELRGAGSDLTRIFADLQAEIWLRAGQPQQALSALGEAPPANAAVARQLQWALLQALAVQQSGDGARAATLWRGLRTRVPAGRSAGLRLRALALSSVVLAWREARPELDGLVALAEDAGVPAAAGLARLRRAAFAWRAGDMAQAVADVETLLAQRPRLQHLYLPKAELLALAHGVLQSAGRSAAAARVRREALAWAAAEALPQLPPACRAGWLDHPAHGGLFGAQAEVG